MTACWWQEIVDAASTWVQLQASTWADLGSSGSGGSAWQAIIDAGATWVSLQSSTWAELAA